MSAHHTRARLAVSAGLALSLLSGCAQSPAVTAADLTRDATVAVAQLDAQADLLVAAGGLDAGRVAALEAQAQADLGVISAGIGAPGPRAIDLAGLRRAACDLRSALTALAAILPVGVLPAPVLATLAVADAVLDAFIAMTPAAASRLALETVPG